MLLVIGLLVVRFILASCTNDSLGDTFRQCLMSQAPSNFGQCLGVGAISRLRSLDSSPEFDLVDGLTLSRDMQEFREAPFEFEGDPSNFRSIFDSFSHVFSKRNLKWDMGFLYPGLMMHIAPSGHPGGTLEFALDPRRESINVHTLKEAGTGRLLARQFVLPLLLGFKFNVLSLTPVLFGLLALFAKKALVISKIALVLSSAFALGTLLFGSSQSYHQNQYTGGHYGHYTHGNHHHGHGHFHGVHGGHFGHHPYKYAEEDDYSDSLLRESNAAAAAGGDELKVFPNVVQLDAGDVLGADKKKGRNFAWSNDEKIKRVGATKR